MTAVNPLLVTSQDASAWDADDGALVETFTQRGVSTAVTDTTLTDSGAAWVTDEWVNEVVSSGGKTLTVTGNTGTVLTGSAGWSDGGNPGTGDYSIDKGIIDDVTTASIIKQGKSPDDIVRVKYEHKSTIAVGDTVTINTNGLHNYVTGAVVPYDTATGVDTANKLTYTAATGDNVVTLTAGFISALFDQGSGTWACRITEDLEINGDIKITEIDSNLTTAAAGNIAELPAQTLTLTPNAPSAVTTEKNIAVLAAVVLTLTPFAPTVETFDPNTAELPAQTLTLTPNAPSAVVTEKNEAILDSATLTLTPNAPDAVTTEKHIADLPQATLTLAPFAPDAVVTEKNEAILPSATLTLTPFAPQAVTTEGENNFADLPSATLTLTPFAPSASTTEKNEAILPSATLTLTPFAPTVETFDPNTALLGGTALVDTGLLARYFIDEAVSGTGPTALIDASPNRYDLDDLNYEHMAFAEISGNRGLDITQNATDSRARKQIDDTSDPIRDAMDGSKTGTLEVVVRVDSLAGTDPRLWGITGNNGENGAFMFRENGSEQFALAHNNTTSSAITLSLSSRSVVHVVVDSDESVAVDRVKFYVDGVFVGSPSSNPIGLGETISFGADHSLIMGNRENSSGEFDRSFDGVMFYMALYSGAFTAAQVTTNFDVLTLDDDTPTLTLTPFAPSAVSTDKNEAILPSATLTLTPFAPDAVVSEGDNNFANLPSATLTLTPFAPLAVTQNEAILPSATLSLTPFAPTVETFDPNTAELPSQTLTLAPFAPLAVTQNEAILPSATLTLTPFAPDTVVTEKNEAILPSVTLTLTPNAPDSVVTEKNEAILPSVTLTLTPFAPDAVTTEGDNNIAQLPAQTLTLTPFAPDAVSTDKNEAILPSATLTLTPFAPTVETFDPNTATLPSAVLTLTPNAPSVVATENRRAILPGQTLTLAPFAPTVVATEARIAILPSATLSLTPFAPLAITFDLQTAQLPAQTLTLTSFAPLAVSTDNNFATLPAAVLTLTPFVPTVFVPGNELSSTNDPDVIDLTDPRFFILIK